MKKSIIASLIATSFSIPFASAQVPNPSIGNQAVNPSNSGGGSNDTVINRKQTEHKSPHGEEVPIIDPTNKVIEFQGRKYSLMDNNLGGQFEAFLATDTLSAQAASEYRATIRQILDYLAPNRKEKPRLDLAFALLSKASEYPGDGNICESLVNSLNGARNTKNNVRGLYAKVIALDVEKKKIVRNMSVIESKLEVQTSDKSGGKKGQKSSRKTGVQSIEYQMLAKRLIEIAVLKKKYEAEGLIDLTQAKIQYQAMIVQLFIQRRFEHVVIATRFYNLVFNDGDTKLRLKKGSDTEKFFAEGVGVNPTVAGMDAAANEAIRKVQTLVSAYNNNMKNKRLHAASERLVEAYAIGEFLPAVQTIPAEPKKRIQQYVQDANDMVQTLEARDLEKAEALNIGLSEQATDYNESQAKSYINGLRTVSKNYVRDATLALYQMKNAKTTQERYNEEERFKTAMGGATKAWPSNPDIDKLGQKIDTLIDDGERGSDLLQIARNDFDGWKKTQSWSAIFNDKERLGGAFGFSQAPEDRVRRDELREVIKNKAGIFAALKEAETLKERGFAEAAWEIIHRTQKDYEDDIELSRAMADYSSSAAEFSNMISEAQKLEEQDPASFHALTWYLKAKTSSPDSKYVNEGISRILAAYENEGSSMKKATKSSPSETK